MEKYAAAMENVCSSYGKGMQQLWKRYAAAMKRYAAAMEKYAAAMEKVCCSYRNGMLQLWIRCVEVTN